VGALIKFEADLRRDQNTFIPLAQIYSELVAIDN
jgi:hypothetical protein